MKQLTCEMCGGTNVIKQDGMYVCQNCGTKYSVEEARKMMMDGSDDVAGVVQTDDGAGIVRTENSTELDNLYVLARRAKDEGNNENAENYYSQIIIKDPSSWEAYFYSIFYKAMGCKVGEIGIAAGRLKNCEGTVMSLIKENVSDPEEQRKAVEEVVTKSKYLANTLYRVFENHYNNISLSIRANYIDEYVINCSTCTEILFECGDEIVKIFGDEFGDLAAKSWEAGLRDYCSLADYSSASPVISGYTEKIKKYNPSYTPPERPASTTSSSSNTSTGGCYVATAVYGSYDCPEVWTLRRYRDYDLAETWYGRAFIHTYYAISPTMVKLFGQTKWFKSLFRGHLDKMVEKLRQKGYESTPYEDRKW